MAARVRPGISSTATGTLPYIAPYYIPPRCSCSCSNRIMRAWVVEGTRRGGTLSGLLYAGFPRAVDYNAKSREFNGTLLCTEYRPVLSTGLPISACGREEEKHLSRPRGASADFRLSRVMWRVVLSNVCSAFAMNVEPALWAVWRCDLFAAAERRAVAGGASGRLVLEGGHRLPGEGGEGALSPPRDPLCVRFPGSPERGNEAKHSVDLEPGMRDR